jgi:hypothetical protein
MYSMKWQDDHKIMNWKACGKKQMQPNLRYYPSNCLKGLRKTMEDFNHDS